MWSDRTDPILHIELRRWADMMVIAPLDANTLAKIANGICDNLLVSCCYDCLLVLDLIQHYLGVIVTLSRLLLKWRYFYG